YTEARHRALCAIRCAANKRPFASQDDVWYQMEVELLRPGTITPSSKVVEHPSLTDSDVQRWDRNVFVPYTSSSIDGPRQ
ncbi:hypothetical protein B0H16DRAFT_1336537, partial [Mycena metata]